MYIFMATFIGLIMNGKCQQTLINYYKILKNKLTFLDKTHNIFQVIKI